MAAPALITTNLVLRFKADDISGSDLDAVSTWTGTGGSATQGTAANKPKLRTAALNGHSTVEFDGTNDMLALDATALAVAQNRADLCVFIAYKMPGSAVSGIRCLVGLSTGTTTGARVAVYQNSASVHIATGRRLDADAFAQAAAPSGSTTGEGAVLTGAYRWSTSDLLLFKNGTQLVANTSFQTAGSTSNTASLTGFIGANAVGGAEWFSGQIAEILAYADGDTSGDLRANVHTYLADTYGLTTPSDYLNYTTLTTTAGLAVAASVTEVASASLATTAGLSASAVISRPGDASLATTADLTAAGSVTEVAAAAIGTTANLTAGATATQVAAAALPVTASLTAGAMATSVAAAALAATAGLAAAAEVTAVASAVLPVTASLSTSAGVVANASAVLSATANLVAAAEVTANAVASLGATVGLSTAASVTAIGSALLGATANLTASAIAVIPAQAAFATTANLTTVGGTLVAGAVTIGVTANLGSSGSVTARATVTLPLSANLATVAYATYYAAAAMAVAANLATVATTLIRELPVKDPRIHLLPNGAAIYITPNLSALTLEPV